MFCSLSLPYIFSVLSFSIKPSFILCRKPAKPVCLTLPHLSFYKKDSGGKEARVEANASDKEIAKETAMDNMTKAKADKDEKFLTHVSET